MGWTSSFVDVMETAFGMRLDQCLSMHSLDNTPLQPLKNQ